MIVMDNLNVLVGMGLEFAVAVMVFVRLYMHMIDLLSIRRKYKHNRIMLRLQSCKYFRRRRSLYGSLSFALYFIWTFTTGDSLTESISTLDWQYPVFMGILAGYMFSSLPRYKPLVNTDTWYGLDK